MLDLIAKLLVCTDLIMLAEGESSTTLMVIVAAVAALLFFLVAFFGDRPVPR